ncbi:ATP-binding cassette domain-containing protein [Acholeplasma vituli]|uniref:ATP-binding cassette domain-containing protein n=1 Tax=Paracholeplasma vituli TaxID=69473 RepID=A0ABT2PVU0_9MOLU|nr:ATP-binding cassette domain-containing protein [Paracholeplasma vituli]MCU0105073.1 ATP-binding cassette domain-containing protein [Paracholeplasma vituli]
MEQLNVKLLTHYTHKMAKIEKKIQFYRAYGNEKYKPMIEKLEKKVEALNEKATLYSGKIKVENETKLVEIQKRLETETDVNRKKELEVSLSIAKDKEDAITNEEHILSLSHLSMRFGGLKAVDDLSFSVKKGEIFGLIGPNGAGKTTVFNCITQFYKSTLGAVYYTDHHGDVHNLNDYPVHKVIDLGIARTFQNVELIWELTVLDNLLVGAHSLFTVNFFEQMLHLPKLKKEEAILRSKAESILTSLGIIAYKNVIPYGLPYGILKKIELARVLMSDPRLIILDEPAAGLNDTETLELAKTIQNIQKTFGVTIILVEHDMELVMGICDRICAMSFGQRLAIGTPTEIQSNKQVQTAYLGGE